MPTYALRARIFQVYDKKKKSTSRCSCATRISHVGSQKLGLHITARFMSYATFSASSVLYSSRFYSHITRQKNLACFMPLNSVLRLISSHGYFS